MRYRCEATSVEGFVQQLACNYFPHGYWFFVTGHVPVGKDPAAVDRKLIEKYQIDLSRSSRARRKAAGFANLHYLRYARFFALLATHGRHRFFDEEANRIRDARRVPLHFAGYSVSVKRGGYLRKADGLVPPTRDHRYRVRVAIGREQLRELKAHLLDLACHRSVESLAAILFGLPFEPYAPVRRQLLSLLRWVNRARAAAGYDLVPTSALRFKRQIVEPYGHEAIVTPHTTGAVSGAAATPARFD